MAEFEPSNRAGAKQRRVSVYDVARAAGVSHQTVSNTLNNPDAVRPATRDAVLSAIEELGYEVNAAAKSLGGGRSQIVGLEVPRRQPGGTSGFFEHFIPELAEAARARSHNVLIFAAGEDCDTTEHRRLHRARLVDGVVVANTTLHDGRIRELSAAGVPFVAFGRTADRTTYPWVDVDNRIGMRLALEHLASAGHRRVGYLGPPADTYYSNERIKELRKYGRKGVIEPTVQLVAQADEEPTTTRHLVRELLQGEVPPTAIVAGSDLLAATVLDVARHLGIHVGPDGLAVIGFDDTPLTALTTPAITTIRQPVELVATHAIDLLLDAIAGRPARNRLLEPVLVMRESA